MTIHLVNIRQEVLTPAGAGWEGLCDIPDVTGTELSNGLPDFGRWLGFDSIFVGHFVLLLSPDSDRNETPTNRLPTL